MKRERRLFNLHSRAAVSVLGYSLHREEETSNVRLFSKWFQFREVHHNFKSWNPSLRYKSERVSANVCSGIAVSVLGQSVSVREMKRVAYGFSWSSFRGVSFSIVSRVGISVSGTRMSEFQRM